MLAGYMTRGMVSHELIPEGLTPMADANLHILATVLPRLTGRDLEFAQSLIQQGARRPLSRKQLPWVSTLIERANGKPVQRKMVEVGDMAGVISLFDKAKQHLKFPAIVLPVERMEIQLRLYPAGERANIPGSINVKNTVNDEWLGRIHKDGRFEVARNVAGTAVERAVTPVLKAFATDPVTGAKESARLTGKCCFCNTRLKDERSTAVGYGSTCASHFGLPWGETKASGTALALASTLKGKRTTASAKKPAKAPLQTGFQVVKTYFPEDFEATDALGMLRGMTESFPVIFGSEDEARKCYDRLLEGGDRSFFNPDEDDLSLVKIEYRTYTEHGQSMMDIVRTIHLYGYCLDYAE
jgi:Family of unknown function (DUF6011)